MADLKTSADVLHDIVLDEIRQRLPAEVHQAAEQMFADWKASGIPGRLVERGAEPEDITAAFAMWLSAYLAGWVGEVVDE